MEYVQKCCFKGGNGILVYRTAEGLPREEAMPLSSKMEDLLRLALGKRRELAEANGIQPDQLQEYVATEEQCKRLINEWKHDVDSWMNAGLREHYHKLVADGKKQDAHSFAHSRFSKYCFQISGCKFLLYKLIQLPIVHAAGGAGADAITRLLEDFQIHKTTKTYQEAVAISQNRQKGEKRLSTQLWWAKYYLNQGQRLSSLVEDGQVMFEALRWENQWLVQQFEAGKLHMDVSDLKHRRHAPYRGTFIEATDAEAIGDP